MKHIFFLAPVLVIAAFPPAAHAAERVALVLGNNDYQHGAPLKNCINDARVVSKALGAAGFEVIDGTDLTLAQMEAKVLEFKRKAEGAKAAWFHYSGHGAEVDGANYLIPVDAKVEEEFQVKHKTLALDQVMGALEAAGAPLKVVVLDCCRDNPFGRGWKRNAATGLAGVAETPGGTIIAFATSPGKVAADGVGENSPFTAALVEQLAQPGLEIEQVFIETGRKVKLITQDRQIPWRNSSFYGSFILTPGGADSSTPTTPLAAPADLSAVPMPLPERAPSHDPERAAREKAALQAAILSHPPRGELIKIARQDESENIRLQACYHLLEIRDTGAEAATLAIHRSSKDPEIRWRSALLIWQYLGDNSGGDFLLADFRSRGRTGPVLNWSSWTNTLIEMDHKEGMKDMKKIWTSDYDANNSNFVKQQIILRLGLLLASKEKSQIEMVKNRMKRLPASDIDDNIYFCLAVLGDESSKERIRSRLFGKSPGFYAGSVPFSKQNRFNWVANLSELEQMIVEAAEKSSAPENLIKNLSTIANAREMWGESSSALKNVDVPFPLDLFSEASKRDLRFPAVQDGVELFNSGTSLDEYSFNRYAPTLAAAGNRKVVERANAWAQAPDPSLRFSVAKLAALYLKAQPSSVWEARDQALARQMSALVAEMWSNAPLRGKTSDFGDEPGKLDLVEAMAVFDKKIACKWIRELMSVYEGLPDLVTNEEWFYDESKKLVSLRPVPSYEGNWERKHRWYREKLLFELLTFYPKVWETPDYTFIDKVSSFEFAQGMAKQGNHANKGLEIYETRQIDSVQQVTARVRLMLAQGGYYEVYPQVIQSIDFKEENARHDVIKALWEFTSNF